VSPDFAEAVGSTLGLQMAPIDRGLTPRRSPTDGVVGLAYSGGADSSAALAVLPPDTALYFLRRVDPPGPPPPPSQYTEAAALHACRELERRGRLMRILETDVVHVRQPAGFTTDWVNAAGALLLADRDRVDSLAWGLIAESAYRIGHEHFMDWAERQASGWGPVFAASGLPMCQPVAGVSEVGTASIVRRAPDGDVSQSCARGDVAAPCRRCWKCFRKLLLDAALTGEWPTTTEIDGLLGSPDVVRFLGKVPIKHENVMAWIMGQYRGNHPVMRALVERTRPSTQDLDWLTRFYGPSLDLAPAHHRPGITARLRDYLAPMSPADEAAMRAWDMDPIIADPATNASRDRLVAAIRARRTSERRGTMGLGRRVLRRLGL
jgi:hypothetical protein